VKDYVMVPKSFSQAFVHTFIFDEGGHTFQLLHTTVMDSMVQSIAPFKGKALLGVRHMLRLYDIGKRQLLKKCEYKHLYVGVFFLGKLNIFLGQYHSDYRGEDIHYRHERQFPFAEVQTQRKSVRGDR
jgi:hypothetical protein